MPRIMAKTGNNLAIKESLCISGCNCPEMSGEIRLCVDFRKLNAISIRDSFSRFLE